MIKGGYGIQRMCINMLYHHTLQNPPVCFPILHHNCFHNTCPYPICPMITGICGNDGLIILFCRKTMTKKGTRSLNTGAHGGARATRPPSVYMHVLIHRSVFSTVNHKVYTATPTPHSCIYSDIFVTQYPNVKLKCYHMYD